MIIEINRTKDINDQLQKDGHVRLLDTPENIKSITALNDRMEDINREFKVKENNSYQSAGRVILTT